MKWFVSSFVFASVFALSQPSPAFWQPISEVTDYEREIIEKAAKKPASKILKDGVEFDSRKNLVVVRFKNGDLGVYGYGGPKKAGTPQGPQTSYGDVVGSNRGDLYNEFTNMWGWGGNTANGLSAEQLDKADSLMENLMNLWKTDRTATNVDAQVVGRRGNRYLRRHNLYESLFFTPWLEAEFWEQYIKSDLARTEDAPSREERLIAVERLFYLLTADNVLKQYKIGTSAGDMILELHPEIYKALDEKKFF